MSEIADVLAAIESLAARGERMALATIVAVRGSTYRRPGARLLVPEDGAPIGNLSGGCLEGDVADMARVVMQEGRARLAGWDLTADDDAVWGLGLGCNGAIDVFIEPADRAAEAAGALRMALQEERPISLVTVLESEEPLVGRGCGTLEILVARSRWCYGFGRIDWRAFGSRELRRESAGVARRSTELREAEAARLVLLPMSTIHSGARDTDHLAFPFGDAYGFVERDGARRARRAHCR